MWSIIVLINYSYIPGEEQKKGCTYSVPQPKGRSTDRHSREAARPADGSSPKKGKAKQQWLPSEAQGRTRPEGGNPSFQFQGVWGWVSRS